MKTPVRRILVMLGLFSTLTLQQSTAFAQGTAFTYQGRLDNGASNFVKGERASRQVILPPNQTINNSSKVQL